MNYYDAKLDEEDLNHAIELYREGYPNAKINVSGDAITTHVEAGFALDMDMFFEDIVTGEEIENRSFTVAEFRYTVDYKLDDLKYDIDDIEKSLNQAIESGQSKFLELALELSLTDRSDLKALVLVANSLKTEIESQLIQIYSPIDRKIYECAEEIFKAAGTIAIKKASSISESYSIIANAKIEQFQQNLLDLALKESDKQSDDRLRFRANLV